MKKRISVIIPTVNAVDELDLTLRSLKQNSDYELELIIVVDPDQKTGQVNQNILKICKKYNLHALVNQTNMGPYGNWNRGAKVATTPWLVFATDDQYFAPHWDANLLNAWTPKRLVAGRLVEPGIIPVYKTNLRADFGHTPAEFREQDFLDWCAQRREAGFVKDGFFIPLLQSRDEFNALGGYGEEGSFGTSAAISNDYLYIQSALKKGYVFGTAQDSYSYHFQASSWKKKTLKPTIAGVVLTHNEERDLSACLKSLSWVSEIIVLDAGSTDKTVSLAKKSGAKVLTRSFDNFAAQRNYALSQVAHYDWAFMLDADEVCDDQLAQELQSFAKDIYLDGVEIPRKNYLFSKWIKHTDWYPDHRLVFFRPKMAEYRGDVHERVIFTKGAGSLATASGHILHHNYDTIHEFVVKNLVDYPLQYAKVLDGDGIKFSSTDLVGKPLGEFMRRFFLCEGYKDGMYGLILSALMAAQTLVAYCYLWEIQGKRAELSSEETKRVFTSLRGNGSELTYWLTTLAIESSHGATKFINRLKRKSLKIIKGL